MPRTKEPKSAEHDGKQERRRKERVLHTRVTESLAKDILRIAEDLRVPASTLVRNVLEDTFSMVEQVTDRVGNLMDNVLDEAERARVKLGRQIDAARRNIKDVRSAAKHEDGEHSGAAVPEFPDIIGWQPLLVNQAQTCAACGASLTRGDSAVVGMTTSGLAPTYLCRTCIPA